MLMERYATLKPVCKAPGPAGAIDGGHEQTTYSVTAGETSSGITLSNGDFLFVSSGGTATSTTVSNGGSAVVFTTVSNGGFEFVRLPARPSAPSAAADSSMFTS